MLGMSGGILYAFSHEKSQNQSYEVVTVIITCIFINEKLGLKWLCIFQQRLCVVVVTSFQRQVS